MQMMDKKSRTMLAILKSGSGYTHYGYLRNNNVFRSIAQGEPIQKGTTHNESEHRKMKRWTECVYQQHKDRVDIVRNIYALYRMLANSYQNMYMTTAAPYGEKEVIHLLAGFISQGGLNHDRIPTGDVAPAPAPNTRGDLKRTRNEITDEVKVQQDAARQQRVQANIKQGQLDLKKGKRGVLKVLKGKHKPADVTIRPVVKRPAKQMKKDSKAIANAIEGSLST